MTKTIAILLSVFLMGFKMQAQQINYESSFENAKAAALQQHKPIAVLISITPPVSTPNFLNGLKDEKVVEMFNSNFINYKVDMKDTTASAGIIRQYKIYRFPSFLFLDAKGGLLFSDVAFLSRAQPILAQADKAISASKEMSLVDYDSIYAGGNYNNSFLKSYIIKRQQAGLTDNAGQIEKYVNGLNISDLNNYAEIKFILKAGPLADGMAYRFAYTNKNIIDSIYKTEPLSERTAMNNNIISNTLNSAIANKNLNRAYAAANFTRGTWNTDPVKGQKNFSLKILQYYKAVHDTTNYLKQAGNYYDQYYMAISVDSIHKKNSLAFETARINAQQNVVAEKKINDSTTRKTVSFFYPKNNLTAVELNAGAWDFYQMGGTNDMYLSKAMAWSRRSIEIDPSPAYYDTYAHLLYKLKLYQEAEAMQKKAVDLSEETQRDNKVYKEEYIKIKKRKL